MNLDLRTTERSMDLALDIANWDGKSADEIRAIYETYQGHKDFVSHSVKLLKQTKYQTGATWLLKRHLEQGRVLDAQAIKSIYNALSGLEHWQARLHVLQCVPRMPIPQSSRLRVEKFLRTCLIDDVKFVRAWAYFGFYELALQYPQHQKEAMQILELGLRDEPASVQARIRKALQSGF